MELGSGRRSGDRGIEEGTALCDYGSALRHEPQPVCRRHPGVAPGRPYVRLANAEGPFGQKLAPPRAVLREGGPIGEGERGAVRARLSKVLEVALERPARVKIRVYNELFLCFARPQGPPRAAGQSPNK